MSLHPVLDAGCRYMSVLVNSKLESQASNPEVTVDTDQSDAVIDRQVILLKIIVNKLTKAYSGYYVDWIDIGLSAECICQISTSMFRVWSPI